MTLLFAAPSAALTAYFICGFHPVRAAGFLCNSKTRNRRTFRRNTCAQRTKCYKGSCVDEMWIAFLRGEVIEPSSTEMQCTHPSHLPPHPHPSSPEYPLRPPCCRNFGWQLLNVIACTAHPKCIYRHSVCMCVLVLCTNSEYIIRRFIRISAHTKWATAMQLSSPRSRISIVYTSMQFLCVVCPLKHYRVYRTQTSETKKESPTHI